MMSSDESYVDSLFLPSNDNSAYLIQNNWFRNIPTESVVVRRMELDYEVDSVKFSEPAPLRHVNLNYWYTGLGIGFAK